MQLVAALRPSCAASMALRHTCVTFAFPYGGIHRHALCILSGVLQAVAEAGGAALWAAGGAGFEDAVRLCCGGLADPARDVGDAWGSALGALAASGRTAAASEAVRTPPAVLPGSRDVL